MFHDPAIPVYVHWIDSTMKAGWGRINPDDIILGVETIGHLVYEDDEVVGICQSLSLNPDNLPHHNALFIPKVAIQEIRYTNDSIQQNDGKGDVE